MKIEFTKMSGAGNDFVVIDNRKRLIMDGANFARKICDRRWGVGADGLLLLDPSTEASYRMMYYNADGSHGGMCGNGGRCIAQFAVAHGIAQNDHSFEALNFTYRARVQDGNVALSMSNPTNLHLNIVLPIEGKRLKMHFVNTGSPHVVVPSSQLRKRLDDIDINTLGTKIRYHKKFKPAGTNVNFIEKLNDNSLKMRTYERGVEDETLACGTGSIACAIIANKIWDMRPPVTIEARSRVKLEVSFVEHDKAYTNVLLRGPATVTFTGSFDV